MRVELEGEPLNRGFVVASQPLSGKGWVGFHKGELIVLEEGVLRFSSHREVTAER